MKSNTNKSKDRQVFKHTAVGTKKININPTIPRGGIRL